MRESIDINCDIGERGVGGIPLDFALQPFVSSVNIACGVHAGDDETMTAIAFEASRRGIAVGAHPSLPGGAAFGREPVDIPPSEIAASIAAQIGRLRMNARGILIHHIKPHGALYHIAESGAHIADTVCRAVGKIDASFIIYGLAGGALVAAARSKGMTACDEIFADRAYLPSGRLVPRTADGAVLTSPGEAARRIRRWLETGLMPTLDGGEIRLPGGTICIHSDTPGALETAQAVYETVTAAGVAVRAPQTGGV